MALNNEDTISPLPNVCDWQLENMTESFNWLSDKHEKIMNNDWNRLLLVRFLSKINVKLL